LVSISSFSSFGFHLSLFPRYDLVFCKEEENEVQREEGKRHINV
jgi:hypothetical protein